MRPRQMMRVDLDRCLARPPYRRMLAAGSRGGLRSIYLGAVRGWCPGIRAAFRTTGGLAG